jgi:hypothetical protein
MNAGILLVDDDTIVLTLIHHMMHEVAPDYELLSVVRRETNCSHITTSAHLPADRPSVGQLADVLAPRIT